jgi:hypothetical protein
MINTIYRIETNIYRLDTTGQQGGSGWPIHIWENLDADEGLWQGHTLIDRKQNEKRVLEFKDGSLDLISDDIVGRMRY